MTYSLGMKFWSLGLASLLLLTGCSEEQSSACKELNRQWNDTIVVLNNLPNTFDGMTQDEGYRWATASKQKEFIEEQIYALNGCVITPR